jgi:hypothetical protein
VPRRVTLKYNASKRTFSGAVTPAGGCAARQKATIFLVKRGPDKVFRTVTTTATGAFSLKRRAAAGKYYAVVDAVTVASAGACFKAQSKQAKVAKPRRR